MTGSPTDEVRAAADLIARIVSACPRRVAGSASERRAQELLATAFEGAGAETRLHPFRFNTSIYAHMVLTFGLAVLGSALLFLHPAVALALHLLAGVSYWGDSTRRFMLLRRLLPFKPSQNLLATLPAEGEPALRVVLVAHADAAHTAFMFQPKLVRLSKPPRVRWLRFVSKSMLLVTASCFLLAAVDAVALLAAGPQPLLLLLVGPLTLLPLLTVVVGLDALRRDEVVPGANDNLTGCAAGVALARRLAVDKPADVELVFVATGAEEAGTGGARALARSRADGRWLPHDTIILGIDGLTNGELRWFQDGELRAVPIPDWLERLLEEVAESDPRFARVRRFAIPTGATDVMPFRAQGYDGVTLGCVDPELGAPRHYHLPTDTPDNLDLDQLAVSIDFAERAVRAIIEALRWEAE